LDALRARRFGFEYVDAAGVKVTPRPAGLFQDKVATPLSEEVLEIMAASGFGNKGSPMYTVSGPVKLAPDRMTNFIKAQGLLYRATVFRQGDPATLEPRIAARNAFNLFATIVLAGLGASKLGNTVGLSQYSTFYADIATLSGGAIAAPLPVPLPEYDFSGFRDVEARRVTDNGGHVGEIIIAYHGPKSAASEQNALAQAIAAAGGVGTMVVEAEATRAEDYAQRLAIWSDCQATPACAQP